MVDSEAHHIFGGQKIGHNRWHPDIPPVVTLKREGDLIATDPNRLPPLALPPEPDNAILGSLSRAHPGGPRHRGADARS